MAAIFNIPDQENTTKLQKIAAKYFEHADIEELRDKYGVKVNVFFDTFYIFSMIQGYWELQVGKLKTDDEKFADDAFLVKAMAFLGYIDNIKIFLPHVAELAEQLNKSYLLPSDEITENEIDAFLEEIKLQKLQDLKELAAQNKLKQYLEQMAPNADTILKANYILSELYWNKRSNRLFYGEDEKAPIISYDSQHFNPISIIQSGLFKKIEAAISSGGRSALTINNFRDAVALCMFRDKIPDKKDNLTELSLFYVSHDIYSRLTEEILKEFSYVPKKGRRITLIKDAEYFIIDAIFKQEKNAGKEASDVFDKIRDIKKSFDVYRDLDVPFPTADIKPLIDKWNKYRNYEFFQRIWEDEKGGIVPLNEHITKLFDHKFLTENDNKFSIMLERERKHLKNAFNIQAKDFGFLEDVWADVTKIKGELKRLFNNTSEFFDIKKMDIFRDEGMTRFSVPVGDVENKINLLWEGFLTSHQHDDRDDHYLKVELTKLIYDGCLKNPQKIDYDKILIAITILYAFRRNEIIIKIVERLNLSFDNRYQIALIYAASMYKYAKHPGVLEKIDRVLLDLENCAAFDQNYKMWIGMGYVKFNVWKTLTTPAKAEHSNPDDFYRRKYLKDGIKLTKRAFNYLTDILKTGPDDDHRMVKYYYTLNNYIYYNVESKEPIHILDEKFYYDYVAVLQTCQQSDQYRQNRFSDTIARYYLAKALLDKDNNDKASDLAKAHRYIVDAINYAVLKDDRFEDLKSDIEIKQQTVKSQINKDTNRDIRFEQ